LLINIGSIFIGRFIFKYGGNNGNGIEIIAPGFDNEKTIPNIKAIIIAVKERFFIILLTFIQNIDLFYI
jgi:hypothetical protein